MTRETKLGLAVATSFLSLVGGVLGVKLYRGEGTGADAPPPAVVKTEPAKPNEPSSENPAVNNVPDLVKDQAKANADRQALPPAATTAAIPVQPVVATVVPPPNVEVTPPAPAMPVAPVVQVPAPQPAAEPTPAPVAPLKPDPDAVALTKSETPETKKPDAAPPAPVVVPPVVPSPIVNTPPATVLVPPPPAPVMTEPKKDEPPAPTALPLAQANPPAPAMPETKKDEPPAPVIVPPPPAPVMGDPKKDEPPAPTALPPAPAVVPPAPTALPPAPAVAPPAPATPELKKDEPKKDEPPKFTFDKPSNSSGITLPPPPPATSTPPGPLSPDINKKAEPTVTVIPATAATAPTALGTPAARPGDPFVAAPPRPAPQPKTQSYLEEEHRWQPGDSFRAVSERYYAGSPKYEAALRAYNRDYPLASKAMKQNAANLPPGTTVWVPPVRILERDYAKEIADAPLPGSGTVAQPASRLVSPAPPPAAASTLYKARGGETMYEISRRTLSSSDQWFQIHRLNPTLSNDPKLPIPAGTILRMPTNAKIDAADRP